MKNKKKNVEDRIREIVDKNVEDRLRELKSTSSEDNSESGDINPTSIGSSEEIRLEEKSLEKKVKAQEPKPKEKPKPKTPEQIVNEAFSSKEFYTIIGAVDDVKSKADDSLRKRIVQSLKGLTYEFSYKPDQKKRFLEKAMEFDRNNSGIYQELGEIEFKAEHYDKAADNFEKAIRLDKNAYASINGLERCAEKLKGLYRERDKAISVYKKLISLNESNKKNYHIKIAEVYASKSELSQAESELLRAGLSQDETNRKLKSFESNMDHILRDGYKMLLTSHFLKKAERESSADKKIEYWKHALDADREMASSHITNAVLKIKGRYNSREQDKLFDFADRL